MDPSTKVRPLHELAALCGRDLGRDALLEGALAPVQELAGALPVTGLDWSGGTLVLLGPENAPYDSTALASLPDLEVGRALLETRLAAIDAEERYDDLVQRVNNAQSLAQMGDYDWHIASDTNRWSDQLYRIYGHEPQSFNASYERFLSLLHPEDRESIMAVHQQAYATGEPYQMMERIVRPDGEVRYLSSNGQVIMDENGTPVRMRGTCIDITDRVLAEQERAVSAERFRTLVEAAPDAVLVLDRDQRIVQSSGRASRLFGGDLEGCALGDVLPGRGVEGAEGLGVRGRAVDGSALLLDVTTAALPDGTVSLFLRDAGPRLAGEAVAAGFREAQLRRRQALEINDNIVQGLTAALYAKQAGAEEQCEKHLARTLYSARQMMNDLLDSLDGTDLQPGDLVRTEAASVGETATETSPTAPTGAGGQDGPTRVLIIDDYDEMRLLLRLQLEKAGYEVVGEGADGREGIELASSLEPHLILLDLAMPRMDGLEALPQIRAARPGARVIVLSGFDQDVMARKALKAGADRYLEKGAPLNALVELAKELLDDVS